MALAYPGEGSCLPWKFGYFIASNKSGSSLRVRKGSHIRGSVNIGSNFITTPRQRQPREDHDPLSRFAAGFESTNCGDRTRIGDYITPDAVEIYILDGRRLSWLVVEIFVCRHSKSTQTFRKFKFGETLERRLVGSIRSSRLKVIRGLHTSTQTYRHHLRDDQGSFLDPQNVEI
ncbi:hypothetical protein EVAR_61477_1 [Eumeta japonica]|uniref:Uncharacterized protein n=1 Tax=Eumeta variegata TaxID=151549 RepID=A0A4C1ZLE8_EUMVA|nr:hypothetical protein EVAR_61477_1 [Eumeta japonica]